MYAAQSDTQEVCFMFLMCVPRVFGVFIFVWQSQACISVVGSHHGGALVSGHFDCSSCS